MKLRGRFSLLASIGLSFGIGLTGCSSESQNQVLPAGSTVIALGDSLTYGYGASTETAYADVLARVEDITKQSPDLVLLGVGGNDVLQRIKPDTTRANIERTVDNLHSANIDVVLIAEPYLSASALFGKVSDNPLYEEVADEKDIPLYSNGWSAVLSDDTLKSDRIHANAIGYRQFAEGLHDYLQEEGLAP